MLWSHARTGADQPRQPHIRLNESSSPLFIASRPSPLPRPPAQDTASKSHLIRLHTHPLSHFFPPFPPTFFDLLGNDDQRQPPRGNSTPFASSPTHSLRTIFLYNFPTIFRTCGAALTRAFAHSGHRPHRLGPFSRDNFCI